MSAYVLRCVCGAEATMSVHGSGMAHVLCEKCATRVHHDASLKGLTLRLAPRANRPIVIPRSATGLVARKVK